MVFPSGYRTKKLTGLQYRALYGTHPIFTGGAVAHNVPVNSAVTVDSAVAGVIATVCVTCVLAVVMAYNVAGVSAVDLVLTAVDVPSATYASNDSGVPAVVNILSASALSTGVPSVVGVPCCSTSLS